MKNFQMMFIGMLGLAASSVVSAAPIVMGAGGTTLTILQCAQFSNDTRIVLSANVRAAADCDDTTIVGISACHATGLTASRSADVAPTSTTDPVSGNTTLSCTAPLTLTGTSPNQRCTGAVTGSAFPSATTAQGTVISRFPGADCDAAGANAATQATAAVADAQ